MIGLVNKLFVKKMFTNKVACVVVVYYPNVIGLIEQINLFNPQVDKILIVDNTPEEIEIGNNVLALCTYVKNHKNLGIAAAHNIGIKWALENGYSHVLLMDQDSEPSDNMVAELLAGEAYLLSKKVKVGAVAPCYCDKESNRKICMSRRNAKSDAEYIKDISLISSGTLIRSEVLVEVGFMNEWLFIDGVDDEWCCRATNKGYELFHVAKAKMFHSLGQRKKIFNGYYFTYHKPFRYYYMFRNYIFNLKQPYVPYVMKKRYVTTFIILLLKILFLPDKKEYLKQMTKGIKDGIKSGK